MLRDLIADTMKDFKYLYLFYSGLQGSDDLLLPEHKR